MVTSTLHTTTELCVSSITTANAHNSATISRLNLCPPAHLNGHVHFATRPNQFPARVPTRFNWPLLLYIYSNLCMSCIYLHWLLVLSVRIYLNINKYISIYINTSQYISIHSKLYQYIPINNSVYLKISLYNSTYLNIYQYISTYNNISQYISMNGQKVFTSCHNRFDVRSVSIFSI